VADATQVNANFASLQGIGPTSTTQLVDLWANAGPCPLGASPQLYRVMDLRLMPDGSQTLFSIPTGQALVLSDLSIIVSLGPSAAGHSVTVDVARVGGTNLNVFETRNATADSSGYATIGIPLGTGSAVAAGTSVCVNAIDRTTSTFAAVNAYGHGFLVPAM
jgi:hypothetical protein